MKIQNPAIFLLFFVSSSLYYHSANAASAPLFPSEKSCFEQFKKSSGNSDIVAAEVYCKDKYVKSQIDYCAEKKLLNFKMKNSISSLDEPRYSLKFKNECSAEVVNSKMANQNLQYLSAQNQPVSSQSLASSTTNPAITLPAANTPSGSQTTTQPTTSPTSQTVAATTQPTQQSGAAQTQTPQQIQQQAQIKAQIDAQQKTATANALAAEKQTNSGSGGGGGGSSLVPIVGAGIGIATLGLGAYEMWSDDKKTSTEKVTPDDLKKSGDEVKKIATPMGAAVNGVNEAASKDTNSIFPRTEISTPTMMLENIKQIIIEASAITSLGNDPIIEQLNILQAQAEAYEVSKKSCTTWAERSGFLCIEGTSPLAKTTRTLIDVSGPVLGVINTAQKACSSTATVTDFAAKGLTLAKGVCVGAKLTCDFNCTSAGKDLALLEASLAKIKTTTAAMPNAAPIVLSLETVIQKELLPTTPGSSPYAAVKCSENVKDIALFALNAAGLVAAKMSAKDCSKKLSSNSTPTTTAAITPDQYCESAANSDTQFCKCKKNSQQSGCPGYIVSTNNSSGISDIAGTNLKNSGNGLSNFANGKTTNSKISPNDPNSGIKQNADGKNSALSDGNGTTNAASGSSGNGSSSIADTASGKNHNSSGSESEAQKAQSNKKWSFEAFSNSMSGFFGGGKGGAKNGNGDISAVNAQNSMIQRKIASDKRATEITSESGKSNWEKIHHVYVIKENSLMPER